MSVAPLSPSAIEYVPAPSVPTNLAEAKHSEFIAINGLPGEGAPQSQPAKQLRIAAMFAFFAVLLLAGCYASPYLVTGKFHDAMNGPFGATTDYLQGILYYGVRSPVVGSWKYVYLDPRKDEFVHDATTSAALQLQGVVPACFTLLAISGLILIRQSRRDKVFPSSVCGYSGNSVLRANTILLAICFTLTATALGLGSTVTRTFCSRAYAQDCQPHFGMAFLIGSMVSAFASFAVTVRVLISVNPAVCD